jgi:xanthine dehydrogenase small subunit
MKLLAGGTDLGVVVNKGKLFPPGEKKSWLSMHLLQDLFQIKSSATKIQIGAMVTLSEVEKALEKSIPEFSRLLTIFASPQIKNIATLVGNIANGSPIGDTLPGLAVLEAKLVIQNATRTRMVPLEKFYKAYKVFDLKPDEVITAVEIQKPAPKSKFRIYKVSQRKDLDISYVSAAFLLEFEKDKIRTVRMAYGGMAGTVIRLPEIEKKLIGISMENKDIWNQIVDSIPQEMQPRSDVRGSALGRGILSANLFKKFLLEEKIFAPA